jgi:hypothetical protein
MNLTQILNLVIQWGSEGDLEGMQFDVSKINNDEFIIKVQQR